ncbi:type 4b pilus protein PilO2 [Xenorhabdus budapestensis]|uniref:Putative type IV secretion system protein PilO2 n=1 Tax=Xenorhabdus budapestensis TaxID=290110 RepID=A0A2D0IT10_XENBU|nr:type 4b pilus protein PilO2 [Xenorhabdus budapestensis]PHM25037.1 putative type IV secretion system protein PilO2 [Xenorhabdus budapestensis]
MYARQKIKRKNPGSAIKETAIRILTINHYRFVVGLEWETIKAQRNFMKEVRKIGKARNLDVVAIRDVEASPQAGFAPKTQQKLRGHYSLIVALASLLKGCCIAVIPLGQNKHHEEEYTLVGRTEKGSIHPVSDTIHTGKDIKQVVLDLKQELRGNQQDISIPVYGDPARFTWITEALDFKALLTPAHMSKDFRLKPLHWGMTKGQLIGFTAVLVMSGVAVLFILHYLDERDRIKSAAVQARLMKQEEINKKARYQAALDKMKHPWITSSSIPIFLQGCEAGLKKLPLSIAGWTPAMVKCNQAGMSVNFNRPDNSAVTSEEFVKAIRKIYGTEPDFNITQTSMSALSIAHKLHPNGDDPMQNMGQQLLKVISLFQSVNIPASLTEVPIKDITKNGEGEDLPLQDWKEYTFHVETRVPPQLVFKGGEYTGIRINRIIYEIGQDQGSVTYKISGSVYGIR